MSLCLESFAIVPPIAISTSSAWGEKTKIFLFFILSVFKITKDRPVNMWMNKELERWLIVILVLMLVGAGMSGCVKPQVAQEQPKQSTVVDKVIAV